MKKFIIYSVFLHLSILLLTVFNAKFFFHEKLINHAPLLVDFVKIGEKAAAPKLAPPPSEEIKTQDKTEDKSQPKEEKAQTEEKPKPKKEEPKPIKEESKPSKKKPQKDKLEKIAEKKKDTLKKEKEKPKPEADKEKKKPKKAQINLKKQKSSKKNSQKSLEDVLDEISYESESNEKGANAETIGDEITASEIDALREKIYKCWIVPSGAKGAKDLVVDVDIQLAPDGSVVKARISDQDRIKKDGFFRIAAESALRAVLDPRCSPLPLPKDKYEQWKNLTFSFNPKDMF